MSEKMPFFVKYLATTTTAVLLICCPIQTGKHIPNFVTLGLNNVNTINLDVQILTWSHKFQILLCYTKLLKTAQNQRKVYSKFYIATLLTKIKKFQGITYVCTERIFTSPQFVYNKIFLNKPFKKLVAYIFKLLFAPFASKVANYSSYSAVGL